MPADDLPEAAREELPRDERAANDSGWAQTRPSQMSTWTTIRARSDERTARRGGRGALHGARVRALGDGSVRRSSKATRLVSARGRGAVSHAAGDGRDVPRRGGIVYHGRT